MTSRWVCSGRQVRCGHVPHISASTACGMHACTWALFEALALRMFSLVFLLVACLRSFKLRVMHGPFIQTHVASMFMNAKHFINFLYPHFADAECLADAGPMKWNLGRILVILGWLCSRSATGDVNLVSVTILSETL